MKPAQTIKSYGRRAFTLVELLVVISIIAILAAIAVPSFSAILKKMKREQAKALAMQIANSIKAYYAEYNKYPLPADGSATEVAPLPTDELLTGTLMATDIVSNPKKINYLPELKTVEGDKMGPGMKQEGEMMRIVDPWGKEYFVIMDADYSGNIENPDVASTSTKLYQTVLVWSAGPDGDENTWEDNITTWSDPKAKDNQ